MSKIKQEKYNANLFEPKAQKDVNRQWYTLTKISDDKFKGLHPNLIDEGYVLSGVFLNPPTVGESFYINNPERFRDCLTTSEVTEIISDTIFKTLNSTYELKKIENEEN